jgi:hypothetical protein
MSAKKTVSTVLPAKSIKSQAARNESKYIKQQPAPAPARKRGGRPALSKTGERAGGMFASVMLSDVEIEAMDEIQAWLMKQGIRGQFNGRSSVICAAIRLTREQLGEDFLRHIRERNNIE